MPRAKKGSQEAKDRMAKARAAKLPPQVSQPAQEESIADLKRRIDELEKAKFFTPQATARGVVGTVEKYSVDPKNYPDPRPKLFEYMQSTPKLRSHGFTPDNYEMKWEISVSNYQTLDGTNIKEPKFVLEVWGFIYEDAEGVPTETPQRKYKVHRLVFHEDHQAAIQIANEKEIKVDESLQKDFLDEMRFLRIRDWMMDLFIPPKYNEKREERSEAVIGNKLVDIVEIASAQPSSIPFSELKAKL